MVELVAGAQKPFGENGVDAFRAAAGRRVAYGVEGAAMGVSLGVFSFSSIAAAAFFGASPTTPMASLVPYSLLVISEGVLLGMYTAAKAETFARRVGSRVSGREVGPEIFKNNLLCRSTAALVDRGFTKLYNVVRPVLASCHR